MDKITKVAVHALIKRGDKYLVTRRPLHDDYMPGYWDTPGGTLDFGEDLKAALNREVGEEIGLKIKIKEVISVCNYLSGPNRHQFMVTYTCDHVGGEPELDLNEHDEYRWVTLEEMGELKRITFLDQLYQELKLKSQLS